eukprot:TRINITY_DN11814_c0_g1_i1.p1 TRINITY_DN11814_c0_g1~~TRINITY_DN11814_c0_g1_i1.p1  ORF type:complete len:368 (+),score=89.51 TRINITY_DN11814_c0_g1_i1:86-1105(+)
MASEGKVPVIDLSSWWTGDAEAKKKVADQLRWAAANIGFLIVTGHNVPQQVIDEAWKVSREFFDLPEADKMEVPMTSEYPYGYIGFGDEKLQKGLDKDSGDERKESIKANSYGQTPDLKESLQVCVGPAENPSPEMKKPIWHSKPADLKEKWIAYYRQMETLAAELLKVMALALNLDENWFADKIDHHLSVLRALNYPHVDEAPKPGQMRAGAHTDYGSLTILLADNAPGGLELYLEGAWHPVRAPANSYIVNLGDLMQRWTNDTWRSTLHRVVPPPPDVSGSTRRQSMAFFHNINPDATVSCIPGCATEERPAKYEPVKAGEWLMSKFYSTVGAGEKK